MQNKKLRQYHTLIRVALIIVITSLVVYFCLQNYSYFVDFFFKVVSILQPIIYGVVLAYLMSPICSAIEIKLKEFLIKYYPDKKATKLAHLFSVIISIIILILIILTILMLIFPQLVTSISNFIATYPDKVADFEQRVDTYITSNPRLSRNALNLYNEFQNYTNSFISNTVLPNINRLINSLSIRVISLAQSVFNFLIGIIVAFYCLDKRRVFALQAKKILFAFLPEKYVIDIIERTYSANHVFLGFIIGKIIDSIIIGIICFVGVMILRIPNPILISVIIGVTNIIPFFGPFLGAIPCTILILLENPIQAIYFVIFVFLLQQFDGNILGPKILGDTTGITSFWVLFSILLFGGLWGIFGMIIAVPLFVVIYNLLKEYTNARLKAKGLPTAAYAYEDAEDIDMNAKSHDNENREKELYEEHKQEERKIEKQLEEKNKDK